MDASNASLRRVVLAVALLNLGYFGVEFTVALRIGSVSLFADSIDFLEDASVNLLILVALAWSATRRAQVGMVLACILLVPALATVWAIWHKFQVPTPPEPVPLSVTGLGALVINLSCALMLAHFRSSSGSLTRAAFLSARNDAVANIAIIIAGGITALLQSPWPDVVVGIGIGFLNLDAAREVWEAARGEHLAARGAHDDGPGLEELLEPGELAAMRAEAAKLPLTDDPAGELERLVAEALRKRPDR